MPTLSFRCLEETSETSASDSPYFLVYAGDAQTLKSDVKRVRRESWDDTVDAGEPTRTATFSFASNVGNPELVFVALLEEDWDADSNLESNVKNWMNNLDGLLQVFQTSNGGSVTKIFRDEFEKSIEKFTDNDDLIDIRRFTSTAKTRDFIGGGGHYVVTFNA